MSRIASRLWFVAIFVLLAACTQPEVEKTSDGRVAQAETAGGSCRGVVLVASKHFDPKSFDDASQTVSPAMQFIIPSSLPVTAGATGRHRATLTFSNGSGATVKCHYRGGRTDMPDETDDEDDDPTADCDGAAGLSYLFVRCNDGSHAGDIATATNFGLHVNGGNRKAGTTTVTVSLAEQEPCNGGIDCATQQIDDGNPCTTDACNATDGVTHTPVAAGTSCSDQNACNGLETCNATAVCEPGTPPTISDGNICTADACDPVLGVTHTPTPGVSCSNGSVCDGDEVCGATGTCLAGTPLVTDDGNACTADSCDPITGVTHVPTPGAACGGTFCAPSICDASAACVSGPPPNLDDGDSCTIDSCDAVTNTIVHRPCSKIDPSVATTVAAATSFLYTGPDPVQVGVAPGTIAELRASVLQGNVRLTDGTAAQSVAISILDHPELGSTTTDGNGHYMMAVNGGGPLVVNVTVAGFIPVQRHVDVPWNAYGQASDIVLTPIDPAETFVDLPTATEITVARGSVVTDDRGTRQATLLVPPGIEATMVMPDGTQIPTDTLTIHATELTVGPNGPDKLPGELPPTSGYTYAVNLSTDEATAAGALHVDFSAPIPFYVEDNYGFPVGSPVPVGFYDMKSGTWQADVNGIVLRITSIVGGIAQIDTTGDDVPESDSTLTALGITLAERTELGAMYSAGERLWRVPLSHFSTPDLNWSSQAPPPAPKSPNIAPTAAEPTLTHGVCASSTIECETQGLREEVDLAGTPFSLNYDSLRTHGYDNRSVHLVLTDAGLTPDDPSPALFRIEAKLEVAGVTLEKDIDCPCSGVVCSCPLNQAADLVWDGRDSFGRLLVGAQEATASVAYVYPREYQLAAAFQKSFGVSGIGPQLPAIASSDPVRETRVWHLKLGGNLAQSQGLGGWSLDAVHTYDPIKEVLYLGNGDRRGVSPAPGILSTISTTPFAHILVMPDGRIVGDRGSQIVLVNPDQSLEVLTKNSGPSDIECPPLNTPVPPCILDSTCAVDGNCWAAEGAPAASIDPAPHGGPASIQIAVGPDGGIYMLNSSSHVVEITPDRHWHIWTNGGTVDTGDGGPALNATFSELAGMAVDKNGAIYVSAVLGRIRRIDPGGTVQTIAGNGLYGVAADGSPALLAQVGYGGHMAVAPNGDVSFLDMEVDGFHILRIDTAGILHRDAGGGTTTADGPALSFKIGFNSRGLVAGTDGAIYLKIQTDAGPYAIYQLKDGMMTRVAGGAPCNSVLCGEDGPALAAGFDSDGVFLGDVAVGQQDQSMRPASTVQSDA